MVSGIRGLRLPLPLSVDLLFVLAVGVPAKVSKGFSHFSKREPGALTSVLLNNQVPLHMQCTGLKPISNVTHSCGIKLPQKPGEISLLKEIAANCKENIWGSVKVMPEKGRKKPEALEEQEQPKGSCWAHLDGAGAEVLPLDSGNQS